jgi:hypothetical protein
MSSEAVAAVAPKMTRAVDAMERDFGGIRTGRASTAGRALRDRLVDGRQYPLEYDGTPGLQRARRRLFRTRICAARDDLDDGLGRRVLTQRLRAF